ncbi:MAG: rhodanese-like domain-containing protein [Campylobacterota bacterium]|nr:rhodanese-like domain-containing protein [Campylobacterota bacterium]
MDNFLIVLVVIVMLFLFFNSSKVSDEDLLKAREAVKNGAIIVDVRSRHEFLSKHVKGATNLPIDDIMKGNINLPKDKEIVVYCRRGNRSRESAKVLIKLGWTVYDVATQSDWEREIKIEK